MDWNGETPQTAPCCSFPAFRKASHALALHSTTFSFYKFPIFAISFFWRHLSAPWASFRVGGSIPFTGSFFHALFL